MPGKPPDKLKLGQNFSSFSPTRSRLLCQNDLSALREKPQLRTNRHSQLEPFHTSLKKQAAAIVDRTLILEIMGVLSFPNQLKLAKISLVFEISQLAAMPKI